MEASSASGWRTIALGALSFCPEKNKQTNKQKKPTQNKNYLLREKEETSNSNDMYIRVHIYIYKRSDAQCNCSLLTNQCPASLQPAAARWLTSLFLKIFHLMLYGME